MASDACSRASDARARGSGDAGRSASQFDDESWQAQPQGLLSALIPAPPTRLRSCGRADASNRSAAYAMSVGARYERLQPRRRSGILGRPLLLCATLILLLFALVSVSWRRKDDIQSGVRTLADKYGTRHRFAGGPPIDWSSNLASSWRAMYRRPLPGSAEWHARYPGPETGPAPRPDWARRLAWARAQGLIADVPQATLVGGLAEYPESLVLDDAVCSYRRTSCIAETDLWRGPQGTWALNFDDGRVCVSVGTTDHADRCLHPSDCMSIYGKRARACVRLSLIWLIHQATHFYVRPAAATRLTESDWRQRQDALGARGAGQQAGQPFGRAHLVRESIFSVTFATCPPSTLLGC